MRKEQPVPLQGIRSLSIGAIVALTLVGLAYALVPEPPSAEARETAELGAIIAGLALWGIVARCL